MKSTRFFLHKENLKGYKKIGELDKIGKDMSINQKLQELIKIYVSQLNRCSFCLDLHTKESLEKGEDVYRIVGLSAWEESNLYTDEEKAVLSFVKEVTLIHEQGVTDETYRNLKTFFLEKEIGELLILIGTINMYNRIGITTRLQPLVN